MVCFLVSYRALASVYVKQLTPSSMTTRISLMRLGSKFLVTQHHSTGILLKLSKVSLEANQTESKGHVDLEITTDRKMR